MATTKPKKLMGQTVLVCGGAGFIGSNFVHLLLEKTAAQVVCFDVLTYAGSKENLRGLPKNRFSFVKGDIADAQSVERVIQKYSPAYVVNFAAETHVDRSIHGSARDFVRTNVEGVAILLSAAKKESRLRTFVQISTDEVYGALPLKKGGRPFTEVSPLQPNSPYAASKAAGDLIARSFFQTYGLPVVVTRCSNNYGPYQHPEKLIPFFISRLMSHKSLPLYGDGKNVRDWIYVEDHCEGVLAALLKGKPGEVYNLGASEEMANIDIARQLLECFKMSQKTLVFVQDRPGHDRRYALDSRKARRELNWKPKHKFSKAFPATIKWYISHRQWLQATLRRSGIVNAHIR